MRHRLALMLFIAAGPALQAASAPVPVGAEFQINSFTTSNQRSPAVSLASGGEFIVVWESAYSSNGDDFFSIQGQIYAPDGVAQGGQFRVNSYTTNAQYRPSVSMNGSKDFVVTWTSYGSSGSDSSMSSVQGQRFAAGAVPQGGEFQVNGYTTSYQSSPRVALGTGGDFVVTWASAGSGGSDSSLNSIQGQRYAAGGAALGGEFQINSYTTSDQSTPAIGQAGDGSFAVVWGGASDVDGLGILGQRFAAAGTALGTEFQVNAYTTSQQLFPAIGVARDGDFVVLWRSQSSSGSDNDVSSIQGQRFAAGGQAQGGQFQVNSSTAGAQNRPDVALDDDGDFVAVWSSLSSIGSDNSSLSIQGQRYSSGGSALGGEFQVNTYTTSAQFDPRVAVAPGGDFVVVWYSDGSAGSDSSSSSIQGQRFRVTGDLQGKVFFDQDFDGVKDAGEPGMGGVPVELYDDQLVLRRTTVTDPDGVYSLTPKEGSWHLRFVRPSAYSFTARDAGGDDTIDSDADPVDGETDPFDIQINLLESTIDAGITNGIGDKVWNDVDRDGIRDGGELGLAGVTVHLRDKGGNVVGLTTTDSAGRYHFNTLQPGEYYVDFTAPPGYAFSPANQGGSDETDSDADEVTGNSPIFTFSLAEIDTSIDAGLYPLSSIGGQVWDDLDGDGLHESGEPGMDGLLVRLLDDTGINVLASQATHDGGAYLFEELTSGTYAIEIVPLGAFDFSPKDVGGDDTIDSDFDPTTARTSPIAFTAPGVVAHVDAGLQVVVLFVDDFENGNFDRWTVVQP